MVCQIENILNADKQQQCIIVPNGDNAQMLDLNMREIW